MSITEEDRLELRQSLVETLGERNTSTLMRAVPPLDYDQLATRADLESLERSLRGDGAQLRGEFGELKGEFAELRAELRGEIAELRGEMQLGFAEVARQSVRQTWVSMAGSLGSMVGLSALIVGFG